MTEDRGQRTDDRGQRTDDRRQRLSIWDLGFRPALARRLLLKSTNMDGLGSCDFYWQMV